MITVFEQKKLLRAEVRSAEKLLADAYRTASAVQIAQNILDLPEYRAARTFFCFVGTRREIDTTAILQAALADGKTLCVPLCVDKGIMEAHVITDLSQLVPGSYGILEPAADTPVIPGGEIDFAVIPCVSCGHSGARLGQGGGYYDRYFEHLSIPTALVCREQLIREDIPTEPHDRPFGKVVTEKGVFSIDT